MTADACLLNDKQLEYAVLTEVIKLCPKPTIDELHLAMGDSRLERSVIEDLLWSLKRFGLIRENGKVIEPTLAAVHAAKVIQRV